jgi:hypothetical protein
MCELPDPESKPSARLRLALEMYEDGVAMVRRSLRRDNPEASEQELSNLFIQWLRQRPGAEIGDCVGSPRTWVPSP